jgi:hypothetical protein
MRFLLLTKEEKSANALLLKPHKACRLEQSRPRGSHTVMCGLAQVRRAIKAKHASPARNAARAASADESARSFDAGFVQGGNPAKLGRRLGVRGISKIQQCR